MKLYSYFRSSAAYRVRIGLNLKGLDYDYIPVNLLHSEQKNEEYMALNPQGLVPAMELSDGQIIAQSVALLEWLEEAHPEPALLPSDLLERARVRSVVNSIACDVHPLCNLSVTNHLRGEYQADDEGVFRWYTTWMHRSFTAIEQELASNDSTYSFSDRPCMADLFLVPQIYNARRFDIPLENFPHITRVVDNCNALPAFADAAPEVQPDSRMKKEKS
jgi:maleylacetoacetate isomerase